MFIVPRAEQWKFGNKRPCGLMVTSHGPRWPNIQPHKSSDWDFQSKFWDVCGEKLGLKTALPLVPCSLGNQASFAWQARQGFAVADMKLETTTRSISSLMNRKGQ